MVLHSGLTAMTGSDLIVYVLDLVGVVQVMFFPHLPGMFFFILWTLALYGCYAVSSSRLRKGPTVSRMPLPHGSLSAIFPVRGSNGTPAASSRETTRASSLSSGSVMVK